MQMELFTQEEIGECFAATTLALLSQANNYLKRLDYRFHYVLDAWSNCVDAYHKFTFGR